MLAYQVLNEIIFSEAHMSTVSHIALPPLQLSVSFVLMSDPIGLPLKGFSVRTALEGASERLQILAHLYYNP